MGNWTDVVFLQVSSLIVPDSQPGFRLVLASDGLWDAVTVKQAAQCGGKLGTGPCAAALCKLAQKQKDNRDDITVLALSGNNAATGCTHNCTPLPNPNPNIPSVSAASFVASLAPSASAPPTTNARHAQHVHRVPTRSRDTPAPNRPP